MKKLFFSSFALFLGISAFAQNGKVISAYNYMSEYNRPESYDINKKGDVKNLEEAIKNIDIAVNDPSTANSAKAWWYRSNIYQLVTSEKKLGDQYPKASLEVVKSFQKLNEINDPKFKEWSDAYVNMAAISVTLFNDGVNAYQKKNYHDAYLFFYGVSDMQDVLAARKQKVDYKTVTRALGNAGLCADNDKDYASAIAAYKKMLPIETDSLGYISLITDLKRTKDIEGAKKYTDEGLAKYPSARDLLIDKINFYLIEEKYGDAVSYLQQAIAQDPKNEELPAILGVAYDQLKDSVNARKAYENALVLNPNNAKANRGLGGMIFNRAKAIQDQMNALGTSKEDMKKNDELKAKRDAIFMDAKPYLEKALAGKPDDEEIRKILNTIDAMTRK